MDAPPQTLVDRLAALQLASPRDWRRAEAICRRLARDLPVFEEIWIDALMQLRRLTPFQANALRAGRGEALNVCGYVLFDRLSECRSNAATYFAKPQSGGAAVALKVIPLSPVQLPVVAPRLESLCHAGRRLQERGAITPQSAIVEDDRVVLTSPLAAGRDARSLLVRRGALPPRTVVEIARQLLSILADAHRNEIVHGDVRLDNLRLSPRNSVSLVDFGVRCCVAPVLSIHEDRPVEWYQGTAPERIGTCAPATAASDIYSLGCLLWHLLAGRPPFPHGDRLAVLSAHRARPLPSIRDFAENIPSGFAEAIHEMTQLDPASRPTDLKELQKQFTLAPSRQRTKSGRQHKPAERSVTWATAAVSLLAICGTVATFVEPQSVKQLLAVQEETSVLVASNRTSHEVASNLASVQPASTLTALPEPDASGVIALPHPGPFAADEVTYRGPLTLRGPSGQLATIVIDDEPLHLLAEEVLLENVQVIYRGRPGISAPAALALIECQNLSLQSCRIESGESRPDDPRAFPIGLAWRQIDAADATGGKINVANCVFRTVSSACSFSSAPRRVRIANSLVVDAYALLAFRSSGRLPVEAEFKWLTLRDVGTVVTTGSDRAAPDVAITASDSILALSQGMLCDGTPREFRWQGSGVVSTSEIAVTATSSSRLQGDAASAEGIAIGEVTFAGSAHGNDAESAARVRGVPQRAGQAPGVDVTQLPMPQQFRAAD